MIHTNVNLDNLIAQLGEHVRTEQVLCFPGHIDGEACELKDQYESDDHGLIT